MRWPLATVDSIKASGRYSLVGGPFGSNLTSRDYVDEGVPVVRGNNLPDDSAFKDDDYVYVTEEKADTLLPNNAFPGDVVFTQRGTLGQVGRIPLGARFPRYVISQSQMKLAVDESRADARYVYYFFRHPSTVQMVRSRAITSGVPHINLSILKSMTLPLPPADVQRRIADILSAYDDLIGNNRRRMTLLERSAQMIYQEWFVRLRFPGHENVRIVDGVPEGWGRLALGDLCSEVKDPVRPTDVDADTPYIGLEHMPRHSISLDTWGKASDVSSTKLRYVAGDILFGKIRPYFHKVGVAFTDGVTSSDTIVLRPSKPLYRSLVLMTVSSDQFVAMTAQTMREGSKMPRADWKVMRAYTVWVPQSPLVGEFNDVISPMIAQLRNLSFQNRKLQQARDILLPRLMSGEIEVTESATPALIESL